MSESRELVLPSKAQHAIDLLGQAKQCLEKASSVKQVMHLRAQAQAAETVAAQAAKTLAAQFYAKEADLCRKITLDASTLMVLAERRLGEMLRALPLAKAAPRNQHRPKTTGRIVRPVQSC